jgi:dTDP-L-rhamnose 4-epimerase
VRIIDSLIEQVHGDGGRPAELHSDAELQVGDVRDIAAVRRALEGVDSVIHLAAEVGVGQSMYEIERYTSVNDLGTAILFQAMIERPVRRVVVASSMSIYGEGLYLNADGAIDETVTRDPDRIARGLWDPVDAQGRSLTPVRTPETKRGALASVYAINKFVQERLTLTLTQTYGMEGSALRLWNAYGPGQALSNPYTGVLAIFASRIANGQPPMIFEDGEQTRDFVHVADVARPFLLALDPAEAWARPSHRLGRHRTSPRWRRAWPASMGRRDRTDKRRGMRKGDNPPLLPRPTKGAGGLWATRPRPTTRPGRPNSPSGVARQERPTTRGRSPPGAEARGPGSALQPVLVTGGAGSSASKPRDPWPARAHSVLI